MNCSWSGQEQFLESLSLLSGCLHLQSQQWDMLAQELLNLRVVAFSYRSDFRAKTSCPFPTEGRN